MRTAWMILVLVTMVAVTARGASAQALATTGAGEHCHAPLQAAPTFEPRAGSREAPAAPAVDRIEVTRWHVRVDATFAPQTAYIQIELKDEGSSPLALWTTPDALELCTERPIELHVRSGITAATVRAYDRHGNASDTLTHAMVSIAPRMRCGTGHVLILVVLIPPVVLGLGIALLVVALLRRRKLKVPAVEVSPLVAEAIARGVLQMHLVVLATSVLAILGLSYADHEGTAALVGLIAATSLTRVMAANAMLRTLARGVGAELRSTLLVSGRRHLQTSERMIARAQQQAVPPASISAPRR